jgi:hypothetical protein
LGAAVNNTGWIEATVEAPTSRGPRRPNVAAEITLSAQYNGGDYVEFPVNGALRALVISPAVSGGYHLAWDGCTPPRIKAYSLSGHEADKDEDLSHITVNVLAFYEA